MVVSYKVKGKEPVVAGKCSVVMFYSETLLNGHPSTTNIHDIMDNSEMSWLSFRIFKQPLKSGHPATPCDTQFRGLDCMQTILNDPV